MLRTAKYRAIVEDPVIKYKPIESLPGIGPVAGRKLRDNGYDTADQVLAQYLALKRNEQRFISWISMVSGVSTHWAAQCFNSLNDWYSIWGRDMQMPRRSITPTKEKGALTNRMLLEQKMLQFNSNANEDRLRSLFSNQSTSLVDISRSTERPKLALERLNKSNFNLAENSSCYADQAGNKHFKKLPSPGPKSVNFKESVEYNAAMPKKSPIVNLTKRPISPILKSRSLTPEHVQQFSGSARKPNNLQNGMMNRKNEVKNKGSSMNNLNLAGRISTREKMRAQSIENVSGSNTFTKSKAKPAHSKNSNSKEIEKLICTCVNPPTTIPIEVNLDLAEELVCTCDFAYREVENVCDSRTKRSAKASRNIEENFVEKQIDDSHQKFVPNVSSTPAKLKDSNNNKAQEWQQYEMEAQNDRLNNIAGDEHVIKEENILNVDYDGDDSVTGSDYVFNANDDSSEVEEHGVTVDSRDLENVVFKSQIDEVVTIQTNDIKTSQTVITHERNCEPHASNFQDNSNEDSGLDVTPKSPMGYQNLDAETPTSDDVDSQSETYTDRTFEVNDTTDAESGFHFLPSNSAARLERVKENENKEICELLEKQVDQCNQLNLDDELKRSNIRLFCDMLSNDLEQLPMEKFRNLKLKILQLVYAEIDGIGEK